jgi:transketolase
MTEHAPKLFPTLRDAFGEALLEAGKQDPRIVVLAADLAESTRASVFAKEFPERFFQVGVAEQNMMGIAAGLAHAGKIPVVCSFAVFNPGRNWDQFRVSVCYSRANVKVVGHHSGFSNGQDGATHQGLEDIAITRCLPNLTVIQPANGVEVKEAVKAALLHTGPVYLRLSKDADYELPTLPFQLGKIKVLRPGHELTLVTCGPVTKRAMVLASELAAREQLEIEVLNAHTLKPFDVAGLLQSVRKTRAVVTFEEHQINGGLGSVVAETLAEHEPLPLERVGVLDTFGESGKSEELKDKYGLSLAALRAAIHRVMARKR